MWLVLTVAVWGGLLTGAVAWLVVKQGETMAALDDIKVAEDKLDVAITDVAAYLKDLALSIGDGIPAAKAEEIAAELTAKAAALEALIPAPPVAG